MFCFPPRAGVGKGMFSIEKIVPVREQRQKVAALSDVGASRGGGTVDRTFSSTKMTKQSAIILAKVGLSLKGRAFFFLIPLSHFA